MAGRINQILRDSVPKGIRSFISRGVRSLMNMPSLDGSMTFSQAGEDAVLKFLFTDYQMDLGKISYLDIGARHPIMGNNTFLFYACGSNGVCVDADRTYASLIQKARPRDKVLNVGVSSDSADYGDFFLMKDGESTFDKDEAKKRTAAGSAVMDVVKMPLMSINSIIMQNFETYPVLLSIDIEGLDLVVLRDLDFSCYPIPVIVAETCRYNRTHIRPKDNTIAEFMLSQSYEVYADTYINTIFVNKGWFYHSR